MRKRLIAGILTVVMVVSPLQLQTVSVMAKEVYQETEEASLLMEDADAEMQVQGEESAVEDTETESGTEEQGEGTAAGDTESESGTQGGEADTEDTDDKSGTQGEEAAAEDTDTESGSDKQEADSDNEDSKDNEAEGENQENGEESAATEDAEAEAETAEEANVEDAEEDETEIEAAEAEMSLTTSATDIASGTYTENGSDISWVIDVNGKLTVEGTGDFAESTSRSRAPWYSEAESIKSAEIKVTDMTDASCMFYGCTNLTSLDLSGFDTSKVTSMSDMFYGCSSLTDLDLNHFDTSNVTSMGAMFWGCENLVKVNVSGFNTSKVTSMSGMFCLCKSLTSVDVHGFDTSNVRNMTYMFGSCENLASVDVSGFDTSNVGGYIYFADGSVTVGSMDHMFYGCSSLTSLDVSSFDTSKVTGMQQMFEGCESLTSIDVSNFDTREVMGFDCMFKGCSNLVSVDISGFKTREKTWVNMYEMFQDCSSLTSVNMGNVDTSHASTMTRMFQGCKSLTNLDLSSFDTSNVESMDDMFNGCSSLTGLDLSSFDTSKVTDMQRMFCRCSSLTSLNVSSFNTGKVENMYDMFNGCSGLTSLDLTSFDTSAVTDMGRMFSGCSSLSSLDVSSFDTSKVEDMERMFSCCYSLGSLNLGNFDTGKVGDMSGMFYRCSSLTDLDLSSFDTSNVGNMGSFHYGVGLDIGGGGMFEGCESLTSLNVSSFNTSNVGSTCFMFKDCKSLTTLDLSSFDTSNVRDMQYMFDGCSSLTSLDISGFNTSNLTYSHYLFHLGECEHLTTIYTPYMLTQGIGLRGDWYNSDGEKITELPRSLGYSIVIMKNQIPYTSTIVATKTKTSYECGDALNTDDLKVYYYNDKGKPVEVTEGYSTNADDIDMSTIGKKILRITYNDMTADVDIIVGNVYTVTFAGTGKGDIAEGTADWLEAGADYIFTLMKEEGSIYTVSAMMGEKAVTPNPDETGNTYTISSVNGNLVITIEKTVESGLSIRFVNENDKKITYTGTAIQPLIRVRYNGKRLIAGTDYTVKYSNNIKVGTAKITVTGKGNFVGGNSSTTFEIEARNIADVTLCGVTKDAEDKESLILASGSTLTPVLYYNNIKLTNKDYVIKDASGTEIAGKKLGDSDNNTTIKIEGKDGGNFIGSREVTLNVVDKKNLTKFTVAVVKDKINTLTYDGNPHYIHEISDAITVTAKDAAKTNMEYGKDYAIVYPSDVISAGTKKFTVVGRGLYTGSISKSYIIKPAKEATLSVKYDGSIITENKITTPFTFATSGITFGNKLSVLDSSGEPLSEGKDYKVSYSGNKQVGTKAKCTITFLGNYKGHAKQVIEFAIAKADLSDAEVIIADKAYTGKAGIYKSVPYVIEDTDGANVLLKSSNYKTTYYTEDPTNNDSATQMKGKNKVGAGGIVWVKLEAKGKNYSGYQIVSYKVRAVEYDLSKAKITFQDADGNTVKKMPYTGNQITDKHIKAVVNGYLAEDDAEIEVIYVNNINKGKATVIIKGTDTDDCTYAGCKIANFSIVARSFSFF